VYLIGLYLRDLALRYVLQMPPPSPSASSTPSPISEPPPSYILRTEDPVQKFLRSCMPNLEYLLPVFIRIGVKRKVDLEGILDWPAEERVSWLMELSKEEWGISRMNVKTLSLAFQIAQHYEVMLVAAGANPRGY
jgi:hypothetical protein